MKAIVRSLVVLLLVMAAAAHGRGRGSLLINASSSGFGTGSLLNTITFGFTKSTALPLLNTASRVELQGMLSYASLPDKRALAKLLERDADLGVDMTHAQLIYSCRGLATRLKKGGRGGMLRAASAAAIPAESLSGANPTDSDPVSNVWVLSSRPSAPNKIWLYFLGGVYTNTYWNSQASSIVVPPYSIDDDLSSFSPTELANIAAIWRAVSEDYAPFNVDVTTIDQVSAGTPPQNYMRVSIGGNGAWFSANGPAGGVASLGAFGQSTTYYQPAFVFPYKLNNDTKSIWEAVSHEVGHTMGLSHDGGNGSEYYAGANGWAPIMGVSYYQPLTQWSKGEYQLANNPQDDLAIIAAKLGYAPPGHGSTPTNATMLAANTSAGISTASDFGIVTQTGVDDVFMLQAAAGTLTFAVSVLAAGVGGNRANLDTGARILNAAGAEVNSTQNTAGFAVTGTAALPSAGTYYIAVTGAGSGDPLLTGYSNYASLGQYALVATYPECGATPMAAKISKRISAKPNKDGTYTCSFTMTLMGSDVDGAAGSGVWSTPGASQAAAFSCLTVKQDCSVSFIVPAGAGGCTATVSSVTKADHCMQTNLATLTQVVTW